MSIDRAEGHGTSVLVARVHQHCRVVIDRELGRLGRRARRLTPDDLEIIDAALDDLVESLLLARLRNMPQHAERLDTLLVPRDVDR